MSRMKFFYFMIDFPLLEDDGFSAPRTMNLKKKYFLPLRKKKILKFRIHGDDMQRFQQHRYEPASTTQLLFVKVCVSFNYSHNYVGSDELETTLTVKLCDFT